MESESPVSHKKKKSVDGVKVALMAIVVVVLCGVSFMAGMAFQKNQAKTNVATLSTNGGFGNGAFGGRMGTRGVSAQYQQYLPRVLPLKTRVQTPIQRMASTVAL